MGTGAVLVTGATGLVGRRLVPRLLGEGRSVRALTRDLSAAAGRMDPRVVLVRWDGSHVPADALDGVAAAVHLAGEPVFAGRLTAARRERIRASRVDSTRELVATIAALPADRRPEAFLCASAVGYYGDRGDTELPESAEPGTGFLADVCRAWEEEAAGVEAHGVRRVSLRIGIVLAREGGALPMMALPFRLGLGGRLGGGRQWFPWIHVDDLVGLVAAALDEPTLSGPLNCVAPEPVRNAELTRTLARVLHRPALLPVPAFALRALLGELSQELLGSRHVLPARAGELGFAFRHPGLEDALVEELGS